MKGARGPADLDHRRQGPHALRGRRGGDPHPRGSRPGRQHHRRRDLRREPRRHHPRLGGGDRHRSGRAAATAAERRRKPGSPSSRRSCAATSPGRRSDRSASETRARMRRSRSRLAAAPAAASAAIETAAKAAVAAALLPITAIEDVTIRPISRSRRCSPSRGRAPAEQPTAPTAFIPPAPERAGQRAPRMPRIDELPLPAQNELRAQRGEPTAANIRKSAGMGLLQRLARSASAGARQEERTAGRTASRSVRPLPAAQAPDRRHRVRHRPRPLPSRERLSRSRNMPGVPRIRGSTRSAGRPLCITRWRKTNSTSRPSCAGRPTDLSCVLRIRPGSGAGAELSAFSVSATQPI